MFTGVILHYLLKELEFVKARRIKKVLKAGNNISIDFGSKVVTAYLAPKYSRLTLSRIKGEGFYLSLFKGEKVVDVIQNGLDRLLIIKISGDLEIVFELFGRRSDCLLLKGKNIIHSFRGINKGMYEIPEPPKGLDILKCDRDELLSSILNGEKIVGLTSGFVNRIREKEREVIEHFVEREYRPTILDDILSPFALGGGRTFSSMNEAVTCYFTHREEKDREEKNKKDILRSIDRGIQKLKGAIEKLSSLEDPDDYRVKGEALLTNINKIGEGMEEVELSYPSVAKLTIALDANLSPQENAQRYFKLYKKAKRKRDVAMRMRKKMQKKIDELQGRKEGIESGENIEGFRREPGKAERSEKKPRFPYNFREFTTRNGYKVLVGKNAESNHKLTFSYARPYDIFLHVKNASGSHTILQLKDKNKLPPMEDIEEAAVIAVRFSKMKNASLVPVSYTQKKYVRSSKKLPMGKVILEREKVIYVRIS